MPGGQSKLADRERAEIRPDMGMGAPGGSPEDSPGDGALIVASVAEPGRFGELFDRHADEIYRYVARRLGPDVATDLVAEVFLIAFRNRGSFDPGRAQARPWRS